MKTVLFLFAALITACLSAPADSQNKAPDQQEVPAVTYEIADQPGSPLKLEVLGINSFAPSTPTNLPPNARINWDTVPNKTLTAKIENVGMTPVRGFVIVVQSEKARTASIVVFGSRLFQPGQSQPSFPINLVATAHLTISVDYVEFGDGGSWGDDTSKRSQMVTRFFEGRDLAISRLKEILVNYPEPEYFLKQLDAFRASGTSDALPAPSPFMMKRQFDGGYNTVLQALRNPSKRVAEGQEIARKLELMQQAQ